MGYLNGKNSARSDIIGGRPGRLEKNEETVANPSFDTQKAALDEACTFLRSFTLGRRGFALQEAAIGIKRVNTQIERLKKLFSTGPYAKQAVVVIASARARIAAAEARVALLGKKRRTSDAG
jgi:hypothetical protein